MKHSKIAIRTVLSMTALTAVLIAGVCAAVGFVFLDENMKTYEEFTHSYTRMAAEIIDGDRVARYLEKRTTDGYYDEVARLMRTAAHSAGARYFYVVVPREDGLLYLWDAQPGNRERDFLNVWEYTGNYPKEETMRAYAAGEEQFCVYSYKDMDLVTAISPLRDSAGNTVAVVAMDLLLPNIRLGVQRLVRNIVVYVSIIMVLAMALYYFFLRRMVIRPLVTLQKAVSGFVDGLERGESLHVEIKTGDEVALLARSFEEMGNRLGDYIRRYTTVSNENQRISTELNLATRIQEDMLPGVFPKFSDNDRFDLDAVMHPAKEVGGDFYDFFLVDDDHLALVVADVSGKGVPAALFMMIAKTLIKNETMRGGRPAEILEKVNAQLCENSNKEGMFVTAWLGILELSTGTLRCADAGHEPPLLYHAGNWTVVNKLRMSIALAMMPPELLEKRVPQPFAEGELRLEPGDVLLQYTDGVTEAVNGQKEMFGRERLLETLGSAPETYPTALLRHVRERLRAFSGSAPQFDDVTMLAVRLKSEDERRQMTEKTYRRGEQIFAEGESGDSMFQVVSGAVSIEVADGDGATRRLTDLGSDAMFGEMAALDTHRRSAGATAMADGTRVLEIPDQELCGYLGEDPSRYSRLLKQLSARLRAVSPGAETEKTKSAGEEPAQRRLGYTGNIESCDAGTVLFREGDTSECMYAVLWGRVGIFTGYGTETERKLTELTGGEYFGEMGLIEGKRRSAAAVALEDGTRLETIREEDFERLFQKDSGKAIQILRHVAFRLREATKGLESEKEEEAKW